VVSQCGSGGAWVVECVVIASLPKKDSLLAAKLARLAPLGKSPD
jgi:hypothetical protein